MQTGQGYLGSEKVETSYALEELIPEAPSNWTVNYQLKKFSFYNEEDCTVTINGTKTIFLRARQGFEISYKDIPISSFIIKNNGIKYNWIGSY